MLDSRLLSCKNIWQCQMYKQQITRIFQVDAALATTAPCSSVMFVAMVFGKLGVYRWTVGFGQPIFDIPESGVVIVP
jgi:hypothetical protein